MPESYCHLYAKELLARWLRDKAVPVQVTEPGDYSMIALDPIRAFVPRDDKYLGVYTEYPICLTKNNVTTLEEPWPGDIPTYEECLARHTPPAYILDIAVRHFDKIKYGIEIVHTHPVPDAKVNMIRLATHSFPFELYEVSASWVLNHCQPPNHLTMHKLVPGKPRYLNFPTAS
jgi:hypothetical protein